MTAGEGGENDGRGGEGSFPVSCVSFFFRHSRGLHGNPVLEYVVFSSAVILVVATGIQL